MSFQNGKVQGSSREGQRLLQEVGATRPAGLPAWDSRRFDIPVDLELFKQLTEEMANQEETNRPAEWWMLPHSYLAGSMEGMLNPWCGDVGQITLGDPERIAVVSGSADLLSRTWEFCNQIDHQGLLRGQSLESLSKMNWRVTDLFSVIDVLLLSAFCDTNDNPRVLEIGGGFGRTAEFLSKSIYPSMRYVLATGLGDRSDYKTPTSWKADPHFRTPPRFVPDLRA